MNTRALTLMELQDWAERQENVDVYDFLDEHLRFKKDSKSHGTYIKGTRKRLYKGRVHSTFLIHGTITGRIASRNPNLHNVTRGSALRRLFVPRSDTAVLGQADYSQAEFRVVAALARDPYLRDVFSGGRNIHEEVGKRFYGESFTKYEKEKYIRAKGVVFGLLYGRGPHSLSAEFKMPVEEANSYFQEFFKMIPETVKWRETVVETVGACEDLVSPFGRRRRFHLITKNNWPGIQNEAYSFLPQSTASDLTLLAGIKLHKQGMSHMLRQPIHDAWLFECEEDIKEDVGKAVGDAMTEVAAENFTDFIKFPTDIGYAKNWGELSEEP
jgi:DNA polymerase-1